MPGQERADLERFFFFSPYIHCKRTTWHFMLFRRLISKRTCDLSEQTVTRGLRVPAGPSGAQKQLSMDISSVHHQTARQGRLSSPRMTAGAVPGAQKGRARTGGTWEKGRGKGWREHRKQLPKGCAPLSLASKNKWVLPKSGHHLYKGSRKSGRSRCRASLRNPDFDH